MALKDFLDLFSYCCLIFGNNWYCDYVYNIAIQHIPQCTEPKSLCRQTTIFDLFILYLTGKKNTVILWVCCPGESIHHSCFCKLSDNILGQAKLSSAAVLIS